MNKYIIAVCTPDSFRPSAKALVSDLKKSNLAHTDLIVLDNGYENNFRHAETMNAVLDYAQDQWVIFIDDDVRLAQTDWIEQLVLSAQAMDAAIIGCVHTYASGEINHAGAIAHMDGSTELLRSAPVDNCYSVAVSSAIVGIRPDVTMRFDTQFEKYQHDLDLCLSAWQLDLKVAVTPRVTVVHEMAGYYSTLASPALAYERDSQVFKKKWGDFIQSELYRIPEISELAELARSPNWEVRYNAASALRAADPGSASVAFKDLVATCPHIHLKAGAHYHLFHLEEQKQHLIECLKLNPHHAKARELLDRIDQSRQ